jgi:plastocyanin
VTGRLKGAACAAGVLLIIPGVAEAKTKTVNMGLPPSAGKDFQKAVADVNDYFPHRVAINVGDKIRFRPVGFHSFDFPPTGGSPLPLISPTGDKVAGSNDAAGAPFWFNGQDQVGFSPALVRGAFGKRMTYTGKKRLESGAPLSEKLKPITVRFKKAGRHTYYCNIHAGMKGVVDVRRKGRKVPSAKADRRALKNQLARSLKTAKSLSKAVAPANTVNVGMAGKHGEEFYGFIPAAVTVPAGTTLSFRMAPRSYDVHTATTGPGNPESEPNSYLGQVAAGFTNLVFDPRGVYPSEMPPARATLTPALHGNGFWNTGVMDNSADSPLPASNSVTFGAPGKYEFYCMIHPFMHGTVTVQ